MNRYSVIFSSILAMNMVLLSCNKGNFAGQDKMVDDSVLELSDTPITFRAGSIDVLHTKGHVPLSDSELTDFKVWASYSRVPFSSGTPIGNLFGDARVYRQDDVFVSEKERYWPMNLLTSFFAYAPSRVSADVAEGQQGSLTIRFTQESNASNHYDFCVAAPALDLPHTTAEVPISFHHALTFVLFDARYSDPNGILEECGYSVRIDTIEISGVKNSRDLAVLPQSSDFLRWTDNSASSKKVKYTLARYDSQISDDILDSEYKGGAGITLVPGNLFLVPQKLEGATVSVTYSFLTGGTTDTGISFKLSGDIPAQPGEEWDWKPGTKLKYNLTVELSGFRHLTVSPAEEQWIDDWASSGNAPGIKILE